MGPQEGRPQAAELVEREAEEVRAAVVDKAERKVEAERVPMMPDRAEVVEKAVLADQAAAALVARADRLSAFTAWAVMQ